jgi:hypothetical protein
VGDSERLIVVVVPPAPPLAEATPTVETPSSAPAIEVVVVAAKPVPSAAPLLLATARPEPQLLEAQPVVFDTAKPPVSVGLTVLSDVETEVAEPPLTVLDAELARERPALLDVAVEMATVLRPPALLALALVAAVPPPVEKDVASAKVRTAAVPLALALAPALLPFSEMATEPATEVIPPTLTAVAAAAELQLAPLVTQAMDVVLATAPGVPAVTTTTPRPGLSGLMKPQLGPPDGQPLARIATAVASASALLPAMAVPLALAKAVLGPKAP